MDLTGHKKYTNIFIVIDNLSEINTNKIIEKAVKVVAKYPNDLEVEALSNECIHLHLYLKQLLEQ